jgi:hypothetical protein
MIDNPDHFGVHKLLTVGKKALGDKLVKSNGCWW